MKLTTPILTAIKYNVEQLDPCQDSDDQYTHDREDHRQQNCHQVSQQCISTSNRHDIVKDIHDQERLRDVNAKGITAKIGQPLQKRSRSGTYQPAQRYDHDTSYPPQNEFKQQQNELRNRHIKRWQKVYIIMSGKFQRQANGKQQDGTNGYLSTIFFQHPIMFAQEISHPKEWVHPVVLQGITVGYQENDEP